MAQCTRCGKWADGPDNTICEECLREFHSLKVPKETFQKIVKEVRDRQVRERIKKYNLTGNFELVARAEAQLFREVEERSIFAFVTAAGRVLPVREDYKTYDIEQFQNKCPFCTSPTVIIMLDYRSFPARDYRCLHCGYEWKERIK